MENTKNSFASFTEIFTKETKHFINSAFDLHYNNDIISQMPLFQLAEFSIQSLKNNYSIKIIKKNNHQLTGNFIFQKDDDTFIFDTHDGIYHIINLLDLKHIRLAN